MINGDFAVVGVLLGIVGCILYLSQTGKAEKLFSFLPSIFWIYFLPMLCATFNLIPQKSALYENISTYFLPASLILLLMFSHLKAVMQLGRLALVVMLAGSLGIVLGGPIVLAVLKKWLPENAWSGFGALSASWVGGSANMLAVKEGIGTPDKIFLPMIVVDTIVPYVWMGILTAIAGYQTAYDRWNKSEVGLLEDLNQKITEITPVTYSSLRIGYSFLIFTVACGGALFSLELAKKFPVIKNVVSTYTWTIIIASTMGILLSFTRLRKLEAFGASKIGYVMLYFVLTSIGARANLRDIFVAPILIVAGFLWIFIHAGFIFAASRLTRAPMFLMATASQANVGGTASAPVVAAIYQPSLASVGLLLAIFGNIIGTYTGIICAQLCRWVSGW
jgi:uncharacterized membrane protein